MNDKTKELIYQNLSIITESVSTLLSSIDDMYELLEAIEEDIENEELNQGDRVDDLSSLEQQAHSWTQVWKLLSELSPEFSDRYDRGLDAVLETIKRLHSASQPIDAWDSLDDGLTEWVSTYNSPVMTVEMIFPTQKEAEDFEVLYKNTLEGLNVGRDILKDSTWGVTEQPISGRQYYVPFVQHNLGKSNEWIY